MSRSNSENPASAFDDTLEDILELLEEDTQHFIYQLEQQARAKQH